ncbi:22435_t:CDS:2, partial [Dentiscutata erythropus]
SSDYACIVSVINTKNGNTGITAKYSLHSNDSKWADNDDYGVIKFDYNGGLQYKTGCFDWGLDPPNLVRIVTFGYPFDGEMNCWRSLGNEKSNSNSFGYLIGIRSFEDIGEDGATFSYILNLTLINELAL